MKNDTLRRRYDSLKYDLKKIEEGNNSGLSPQVQLLTVFQSFTTYLYEIFLEPRCQKRSQMRPSRRRSSNERVYTFCALLSGGGNVFVIVSTSLHSYSRTWKSAVTTFLIWSVSSSPCFRTPISCTGARHTRAKSHLRRVASTSRRLYAFAG